MFFFLRVIGRNASHEANVKINVISELHCASVSERVLVQKPLRGIKVLLSNLGTRLLLCVRGFKFFSP